ncbi:NAD(P)H-hydrate dehydratase [Taibaiella soli]|uniref:Bifunctional NAD(P)H-hydrate repair enzyme n=1 Tax=Taibaiella soli TaxID=1649169 RepID=A0A2W2BDS6_9BACT|nr:NAD(P)H-hydrate dehydratase [Taibaiella soli]PZF71746.1 bifunctional ADP-dependent NAD(P)H-hydrate dehydratase/NAD(P)H-hydrate epimerase [Taibaiella soli]
MKIFSAEQIRACDAYTIHASGIRSIDLMERAAVKAVEWLTARFDTNTLFVVLCGAGNNGGDGLAITRLLHRQGYGAKAFLLKHAEHFSADCFANLQRLQQTGTDLVELLSQGMFITDIPPHIIIIDAILGTGLNRPVEGWLADFIRHVNQLPNRKVAIDTPSGLPADTVPVKEAAVVQVKETLSFQFYKRSFLHPEGGRFAGDVHILDINLDSSFISSTHTSYETIDDVRQWYEPRNPFAHKGTFGSALMIGGSYGMIGAIALATHAVLRSGAGKVRALIPQCGYEIMQTAIPEAMCATSGEGCLTEIGGWEGMQAIGIGPGIGTDPTTVEAFTSFLEACKQPLVIDADALNILAKHADLLGKIPAGSVLTPHPKEFERMFGAVPDSMAQVEHARAQAMRYNISIVLKGHHTAVITPEGACWYNLTGNAGMATGGSGDVLCGLIAGLMAQGYEPDVAAIMGVYVHGKAGDLAAAALSQEAMIAGDIINYLGNVFLEIADGRFL